MDTIDEKKKKLIRFCKEFMKHNGYIRVGYAFDFCYKEEQYDFSLFKSVAYLLERTGKYSVEKLENGDFNIISKHRGFQERNPLLYEVIKTVIIVSLTVLITLWLKNSLPTRSTEQPKSGQIPK